MSSNLTDNVWDFLSKTSDLYGRMQGERFSQEMHSNCIELGMQSPIEHLFWIALNALCEAEFTELNPEPYWHPKSNEWKLPGGAVYARSQAAIGSYRVDFLIEVTPVLGESVPAPVVVELDGHDFHDKDKRQRSYEKKRDRELTKRGYRVVHYTGSDVVKDPFVCVREVLEMLGVVDTQFPYRADDPLGQGY